jgi:hypothetical protein
LQIPLVQRPQAFSTPSGGTRQRCSNGSPSSRSRI